MLIKEARDTEKLKKLNEIKEKKGIKKIRKGFLKSLIFMFCSTCVFTQPSFADPLEMLKILGNLYGINLDQLTVLKDVKGLNEALKEVSDKQLSAVTGHYKIGNLYNSSSDQLDRLSANSNWQDLLHKASGGNAARYTELVKRYQDKYPALTQSQLNSLNPNNLKTQTYLDDAKTNLAGLSVSEYSYDSLENRIKKLQGLLNQVEQTPNEKAAMDLQARVLAEIGFVQLEMLRLQSVQTQMTAMHGQGLTNGTTQDAQFVKWNK